MKRIPVEAIPVLLLIAFVLGGYLWHLGDLRTETAPQSKTTGEAEIGGAFSLTDQNGEARTDIDFQGKFMLVFFGFTYCPDVCPTTLAVIANALERLGLDGESLVPVLVTVDPERDTPEILKAYLSAFGPRFVGLTGSEEKIAQIAKAYRVYYKKRPLEDGDYTMDHSNVIYLMGPKGKFVDSYSLEVGPEAIAASLRENMAAARS